FRPPAVLMMRSKNYFG
ncbi:bacterial regulatory helix-turn-helix s, AraC family protein, partial [Vibrio cholerae HC-41B1]